VGNLGPIADANARVQIAIRDLDQTVIANPAHVLEETAVADRYQRRLADAWQWERWLRLDLRHDGRRSQGTKEGLTAGAVQLTTS
jgi:hypothetical protein